MSDAGAAAELSGYAGKSAAFGEKILNTLCFDSFILKQALKQRAASFKSSLARNELITQSGGRRTRFRTRASKLFGGLRGRRLCILLR